MIRRIDELAADDFFKILPPSMGSARDARTVVLGSPMDSCCSESMGAIEVKADRDFAQAVSSAYDRARLNRTGQAGGFGSGPSPVIVAKTIRVKGKTSDDPSEIASRAAPV